jgi:hypothetical protein
MTDPKLVTSSLSRIGEENGDRVEISIYRLEDTDWSLEGVTSITAIARVKSARICFPSVRANVKAAKTGRSGLAQAFAA